MWPQYKSCGGSQRAAAEACGHYVPHCWMSGMHSHGCHTSATLLASMQTLLLQVTFFQILSVPWVSTIGGVSHMPVLWLPRRLGGGTESLNCKFLKYSMGVNMLGSWKM